MFGINSLGTWVQFVAHLDAETQREKKWHQNCFQTKNIGIKNIYYG